MKRTTLNLVLIFCLSLLAKDLTFAQNYVPFNPRYNNSLKGDMLLIGNGILNRNLGVDTPNVPYNATGNNNSFSMQYIDVDGDPSTFSSSNANLTIPSTTVSCYRIAYAALYWGGLYSQTNLDNNSVNRANLNAVKLKLPGAATYTNIVGTLVHDAYPTILSTGLTGYTSFADVTTLLQGLTNANGTYTVADVVAGSAFGSAGGWSLFIVYEDPLATAKNITSFDGFSSVISNVSLNIPISGFTTIPTGPVRSKVAFSALEGDRGLTNDRLRINGVDMSIPSRPANNFFNSTINDINGPFNARVPNSTNLLGFDAGIFNVPNAGNTLIANNATSANLTLVTTGDAYFYYFNAFAIEIIQPQVNLIKSVKDLANVNIGNGNVTLGQELFYELDFQNIGNDNATFFTISDILPTNVDFLPADLVLPPGVTYTFNLATNTIVFTIPNALVTQGGAKYQIRIKVKVVDDCNSLRDACSNEIRNLAFKTYNSQNSGNVVENQQPSASGINSCLIPEPGTTNFLVGIDGCTFTRDEILCGSSVVLTAGSGYLTYQWHNGSPPTAANAIAGATSQSYTVNTIGTYSVVNTAPAPCLTITETINVIDFNGVVPNPIIPYADEVAFCTNLGSDLPKIFLCGAGDSRLIETNILNATSIIWEKLDETSCPPSAIVDCPNTNASCAWLQVGTGPNYSADAAGQYRVRIIFQNGCFRTYYFNVFQNLFTPTEIHRDIICTTPGSITINGVPAGYEFSLNLAGPWQNSNVFTIPIGGNYTVYIRQIGGGVGNCVFTLPNIPIRVRDFTVDVIPTQPLCNGSLGSIRVQVNNVEPQYTYQLFLGATLINSAGPINTNDYIFSNLNPGTYTVIATTADGCTSTQNVTLTAPSPLTVTAGITIPLTCNPGEITIYPVGGTPPYIYQVSTIAGFQTTPQFEITTAGTYNITVTDFNNCVATTTIVVNQIPPPVFTVSQTNVLCYGNNTGNITFNVTNSNGYTLLFSIDNGVTFTANPVFPNLIAGSYQTVVQYSLGTAICSTIAQPITITEPSTALTASGGVSQLAGCGPLGEGEVRITNPQGGIPPYQYSFDNGVTYGGANTAFLAPGTYTLYIRDANFCVFPMSVTIDPAPNPPTIVVDSPSFNCNGTATSTVTVNNNGGNFAYTYLLDGVLNTNVPSNIFLNVPCGNHIVKVQYQNLNIPTFSNLLVEDFGRGSNTTTTGIAAAYCFNSQPYAPGRPCGNGGANASLPGAACPNPSRTLEDNQYVVTSAINPNNCAWFPYRDHTSNGVNPTGRFLAVNIGSAAGPFGILYSKPINNVLPNQPVIVDIWLANLLNVGNGGADPDFILELVDGLGNVVASQNTGIIDNTVNAWQLRSVTLNPGPNTNLTFNVRSGSILFGGNDAAIDDIRVYQLPIACITEVDFPINIACNQAFTASITSFSNVTCNGANNGQVTIAAQNFALPYGFDYSLDNGVTWINSTTSPVVVSGLAATTYNILVRYDNTSGTCSFPFTQVISQPTPLVASANVTSPATCLNGATITVSASGGTPNYQYQLQDNLGNIIVAFQNGTIFSNVVPGDYIVVVRDASGCLDPLDLPLNIPTPVIPTASISTTSDLCYDGVNTASIIVDAINGVVPYQYNINGGLFQSSNTFLGLTPGTYIVTVRDAYGCSVTLPSVTIAQQLTANVLIANNLNCTASPNATISGTVSGGNSPYSYQVSFNGGGLGVATAIVGTTFNYSATTSGTYQFTITDAIGCSVVTSVVTISPLPILLPPAVVITNPILCNGDSNASISVTPSGGLSPYVINVLNTTTGVNYLTQTSGLTAGNYTISTTDANSCVTSTNITINEPAVITFLVVKTDIQCAAVIGTQPGAIDVTNVSGGTFPYTYIITNSFGYFDSYSTTTNENHSFTILNFGIYTVTVVDANGCQLVQNAVTIASPPNSLTIDVSAATVNCAAGGIIEVTVNPIIVGGPYFFAIYQDLSPAIPPYPTYPSAVYQAADGGPLGLTSTFTGLTPGVTYSFIVYDQTTNCYYFETATGPVPTPSSITSTVTPTNVTCTGFADGSVSFTFQGYSGTSVSYQIFTALNNLPVSAIGTSAGLTGLPVTVNNFGILPPGVYYVLFTENDGANVACSQASAAFTITESAVFLSLTASVTKNDNCNFNAGQISVIGSNGTAPYQYQLVPSGGPAPTLTTWAGQVSSVFNTEGGTYDVYIKDSNNCIQTVSIVLPTDSSPQISLILDATTTCNASEGNYSIIVTRDNTVGIAPFTYSVDGGAFNTYVENAAFSFTISGLNSGSHTVIVRDINGCVDTRTIVISPPLNSTGTATIAPITNCGVSDGIITVNPAGGSGSYTFSIAPNPAVITLIGNVFSNVPANTYTVTITDNITNCTFNVPVTIAAPSPVVFTTSVTNATCSSGTDGSIIVSLPASNTDPVYTYEITAPIIVAPQLSNVFNGLAAGTYTLLVTSSRGCTSTQNILVGQPAVIVVPNPVVSQFNCNSGTNATNFATITVNGVTGGSSTYLNYEFILGGTVVQSGSSNVYTESNLLGGTYTINVYDNNGCVGTNSSAIIAPFITISSPSVAVINHITCITNQDITINVVVTGGVPPTLNYTVQGLGTNTYNVTQTSPNFTGLTVGNYSITVENPITSCSVQTIHYVFEPNTFIVTAAVTSNVICFGSATGSATITFVDQVVPTDEAGPFNYTVIHQGTGLTVASGTSAGISQNLTNLIAGIYQVQTTLVGIPTCPAITNFTITQPAALLAINATSSPITCIATSDDGTISASALDGWGAPYEFQLELGATVISPWSSTFYFTGLGVGTYTVSVRDALGCIVPTTVVLAVPTPINASINATVTSLLCFDDTTDINVTGVSGGAGSGYLYSLINVTTGITSGPQSSTLFQNVAAGTYNVVVSDSFTCTFTTANISITQPANDVSAQFSLTTTPTCLTNATITLTASGGTAPYGYSTTPGGPYTTFAGSATFSVPQGTYQYYVIDANNCLEVNPLITVLPVVPVSVSVDISNATILCNGSTASVTATAIDGLGGYTYTLLPATLGVVQTSPGIFTNVPAGSYTIIANSGDCVSPPVAFTISEPTQITAISSVTNVTCNGLNNGIINVIATGGTGTIQYSISSDPFQTVNNGLFTGLAPGNYVVSVQDQAGCFLAPLNFTITEPASISLASFNVLQELCFNDGGSISFTLTGGTTTPSVGYTVSVNGGAIIQTSLTGVFSFSNLAADTYNFIITDANGCDDFQFTQILNPGVDIQPIIDPVYLCTGNIPTNEVVVDVNPSVPLSEFTFSLDGALPVSSNVFSGVSPGIHLMTITHISGCIEIVPFNILSFTSPILTLAETGLNQFTATTTGGAGGNEYTLNGQNVGTTTVYTINQTGNYTVTVTDDNGCEDTKIIFMTFYDVLIPDYFTPDGDGNNDGWGPIYTDSFPNLQVYIFDRYGRKIKTLGQGDTWDGMYNNNPLPTGDYWYVLKLNGDLDTREFVGNFTLYR